MTHEQHNTLIAERIAVPVANPANAEGLLRLGLALLNPLSGRLFAVYVTPASAEPRPEVEAQLQEVVDRLGNEGHPIELVKDVAPSAERGILDVALEHRADLIVLGIQGKRTDAEHIVLGPLVEAVARTAPHNLIIYRGIRRLYGDDGFREVFVTVDSSPQTRLAARIATRLAEQANALLTACHIQTSHKNSREDSLRLVEQTLAGLGEAVSVRKVVARNDNLVDGILSRADDHTLVVFGISEQERSLDAWLTWEVPKRLLNETPGPLIIVKQSAREVVRPSQRLLLRINDMMPTLTPGEMASVTTEAGEMARPTLNFFMLVILSSLIAALGLLQNSAAVIIGAMLIAPLMSPLMGFAVGLTQGKLSLMREAAVTVVRGLLLGLVITALLGLLSPIKAPTNEMLARGQPSLLDMWVAIFSGAAGAFALARKDIASALAGVAIAAALMPPLCTVGMSLAFGETALAGGAFLLFLTNIISISFAAAIVFIWMGMRLRAGADDVRRYRLRVAVSVLVLLLLSVPLTLSLVRWVQSANQLNTAWVTLREVFGSDAVIDVEFHEEEDPLRVIAAVRTEQIALDQTQEVEDVVSIQRAQRLLRQRISSDLVLLVDLHPLVAASEPPAP